MGFQLKRSRVLNFQAPVKTLVEFSECLFEIHRFVFFSSLIFFHRVNFVGELYFVAARPL